MNDQKPVVSPELSAPVAGEPTPRTDAVRDAVSNSRFAVYTGQTTLFMFGALEMYLHHAQQLERELSKAKRSSEESRPAGVIGSPSADSDGLPSGMAMAMNLAPSRAASISKWVIDIDATVDKFLGWRLPEDFYPDCGISFNRGPNAPGYWPVGTNLFSAIQAKQMFTECLTLVDFSRANAKPPSTPAMEPVKAWAVFDKNGKFMNVGIGETAAWYNTIGDNPSYQATLTEQGYTCRQILIVEANHG